MSRYYVRETLGDMTREVGYDTLAEVNDRLSELESHEYKRDDKPKRLLTVEMIREVSQRYFNLRPLEMVVFNHYSLSEKDPCKSVCMNLFLSDLTDMLNAELSK